MRRWQAHIALAQMIGDPIVVSGSPVTVIPDGVRYSRQLRDLYLYRAMLSIMDSIVQPALQAPDAEASAQLQRYLPNYVVEDIVPYATWSLNNELLLTRRPVYVHAVYFETTKITFIKQPANRFHAIQSANPYHDMGHDAMYSVSSPQAVGGTESYGKGKIKVEIPQFNNTTDSIHALYIPTPIDPSTQTASDVLDFEPLLYDKVISVANSYAKADAQEAQGQ
jgi:hypothetical protein